jgi:hypothetical protein
MRKNMGQIEVLRACTVPTKAEVLKEFRASFKSISSFARTDCSFTGSPLALFGIGSEPVTAADSLLIGSFFEFLAIVTQARDRAMELTDEQNAVIAANKEKAKRRRLERYLEQLEHSEGPSSPSADSKTESLGGGFVPEPDEAADPIVLVQQSGRQTSPRHTLICR